jgi:hypothetical protein
LDHQRVRKKWNEITMRSRKAAVNRVESRNASSASMSSFFHYGRGTGGGAPVFPPPMDGDQHDVQNFVPVCVPPHLGVHTPPANVNIDIVQGPEPQENVEVLGQVFYNY